MEQLTHARELLAAIGFGQETVVPNAVEAVGQDVEEKAANELVRGEPHDAALAAAAIVLVTKRHFRVGDGDEPGVADRRPIRGARQISQHPLGPAEGRLGVDDERAVSKRANVLAEDGELSEAGKVAEEAEFATLERGLEPIEEQPTEGF